MLKERLASIAVGSQHVDEKEYRFARYDATINQIGQPVYRLNPHADPVDWLRQKMHQLWQNGGLQGKK